MGVHANGLGRLSNPMDLVPMVDRMHPYYLAPRTFGASLGVQSIPVGSLWKMRGRSSDLAHKPWALEH